MMKSMDLTVGDTLYLYTICSILPDSSDLLPYKESLFLWLYRTAQTCMAPSSNPTGGRIGRLSSDIGGRDKLDSLIFAIVLIILMNLMMILMILMNLTIVLMIM
jgi:hypothetical protein